MDYEKFIYNNKDEYIINRSSIREEIMAAFGVFQTSHCEDYYGVFSVYGMGGVGKSQLIKYLQCKFGETFPKERILFVSFEINSSDNIINGLIAIRKVFRHPCPIFDYALLCFWDRERVERIDDDFMHLIKKELLTSLDEMMMPCKELVKAMEEINLGNFPSLGFIQEFLSTADKLWKAVNYKEQYSEINNMDSSKLLEMLPIYLANDIKNYNAKHHVNYIFIFDAYQQSVPYSKSKEWLLKFITELKIGFFIICSREEICWDIPTIKKYELKAYPKDSIKDFLVDQNLDDETVETIINRSKKIPIFVTLALRAYQSGYDSDLDSFNKAVHLEDESALIKMFLSHLPPKWNEIIEALMVVRIFDESIFEHLVKDINYSCPLIDYDDIIETSLIDYTEKDGELYKIHDVLVENVWYILKEKKCIKIFRSYLSYIKHRKIPELILNKNLSAASVLLGNIIYLEKNCFSDEQLSQNEWADTIDIFLSLSDLRVPMVFPKPSKQDHRKMHDVLLFIDAVLHEKENTNKTYEKLAAIKDPYIFGKHKLSYDVIFMYVKSLKGDYVRLKEFLEEKEKALSESDKGNWYYQKIYIYLIDIYIIMGQFNKAYEFINLQRDEINASGCLYDYFLFQRSEGHLWRFNLDFTRAYNCYSSLLSRCEDIPSLKAYLYTNICETKCFTEPDYVLEHYKRYRKLAEKYNSPKNIGKLLYSRGIANAMLGKYNEAYKDIDECIHINRNDGYDSGILFGFIAKGYVELARDGKISESTETQINKIIKKNKVYNFLFYPFELMRANKKCDKKDMISEPDWIDAENIKKQYCSIIHRLYHQ